jgi:hypothetical protein
MSKMEAKQGENTALFNITIEGLTDYTDYFSKLFVFAKDDTQVLGPIAISPTDNNFAVALSPEQTLALPLGSYTVVFQVYKEVATVIEFSKEISWPLKITESLIYS